MSNPLSRFRKTTIGSNVRDNIYDDKLLPSGDFVRYEGIDAILTSWKKILTTTKRTSDHDPEYGTRLPEYIFQPHDNETKEKIIDEVRDSLMTFDNRAIIQKIDVVFSRNRKGFVLNIRVRYDEKEKDLKVDFNENLVK